MAAMLGSAGVAAGARRRAAASAVTTMRSALPRSHSHPHPLLSARTLLPYASQTATTAAWHAACARCMHSASALQLASGSAGATAPAARSHRTSLAASQPPAPLATPTLLPRAAPTFTDLHVASVLAHRLADGAIHRPTVIQTAAIPHLMRRPWDAPTYPDVLIQEMTGQGKTLAYLLPMLSNIDRSVPRIQAMVVVPTRELAVQVSRIAHELAAPQSNKGLPLAIATLVGDSANPSMLSALVRAAANAAPIVRPDEHVDLTQLLVPQHHPHLLVGTPAVLHDIFVAQAMADVRSVLPLTHLKYIVFDEVDAQLNSAASRNLLVPLIGLRHHARALTLEHVRKEQAHLDATREQRKNRKQAVDEAIEAEARAEAQRLAQRDQRSVMEHPEEEEAEMEEEMEGEQMAEEPSDEQATTELAQAVEQAAGEQAAPQTDVQAQLNEQAEQQEEQTSTTESPAADADAAAAAAAVTAAAPAASGASSSPSLMTPTFPRNQVVFVSATITPAVHQFAARFLSPSRAFITADSVAGEVERRRGLKARLNVSGAEVTLPSTGNTAATPKALVPAASSSGLPPAQRMPSHIRHYYLLVNRPYDRTNSLQQLLQAIKFQFEKWKKGEMGLGADQILGSGKKPSASFLAKLMGPMRAQSAGGVAPSNASSSTRYLKGGVGSLGVGARGHFLQSTLVFCNQRASIPPLVNPLSQQGFQLGVVSEKSSRHERRESLQLEKGVELVLATDVLARGMDLKSLTHVVNWDPPPTPNLYLHRAGRVGRLGAVHAKLGTVITLVDLQQDPRALEHLSKVCASLGGAGSARPMRMQRIYVKKGKIFEDVDPAHDVTAEHTPALDAFVADKEARVAIGDGAGSGGAKEQSVRMSAVPNKADARKVAAIRRAAAGQDGNGVLDGSALEPLDPEESHAAARELGAVFGSAQLDSLRLAELELTQMADSQRKGKGKARSKKKPRDVPQSAAPRAR